MSSMESLLAKLGHEIQDPNEETYDVFSQPRPSQDLGMVDARAESLDLTIAGRDFEVKQSPGVLQSSRGGGTTGAAVWQASVRFAEWLAWPKNPLFSSGALDSESAALELGAGISGLVPCVLRRRVRRMVVTDQSYVLKSIRENIAANAVGSKHGKPKRGASERQQPSDIDVFSLDWENDDIASVLSSNGLEKGVDAVLACDCIFNYALIQPLVESCVDICKLRIGSEGADADPPRPTLCVIAQQLRQPEVFEQWLEAFHEHFRTWRIPDEMLTDGLKEGTGFVVHVGLVRCTKQN
ncbi:Hypothetical predicted protein [Lecanosticta acicola]|uniref:Diaminohydroxyphosphoribosylamino-pyrimidine deaminase n=1 Tax=Lecanosticta acicola TaxID=111012 RepID=A0AAI8Z564_9PEZI|nr:Hypothetical predicted protein [Lecanosticta acicola]